MARLLYTVETGLYDKGVHDTLEELGTALRAEFPAFYVYQIVVCDRVSAVVIENMGEVPPVEAWNRLDGWGIAGLTLELVK